MAFLIDSIVSKDSPSGRYIIERLKMADSSSETANDLPGKMAGENR
jgi:hypothetical protein